MQELQDFDSTSTSGSGDMGDDGEQNQDGSFTQNQSIFHKFSPLCAQGNIFNCHICLRPYGSVRGLNNHQRADHGAQHVDKSIQEVKGTCKLPSKDGGQIKECGLKFTTHQVNKHLKTHGVSPPPGHFLRGFMQSEDGTFSCVFLRKEDPDPDVEGCDDT